MENKKQWKICFQIQKVDFDRGQQMPKSFKMSEKLREAYKKILKDAGA